MKPFDIWITFLIAAFIVGVLGAGITGDVRWVALSVLLGAILARWMRA